MINRLTPLTLLMVVPELTAFAQQSTDASIDSALYHRLRNVVITGQYRPVSSDKAVQRIRVIDERKIAAMGAQNLRDVLMNEMNVSVSQDNVLGSSVRIQGIAGQNVKILIDGVPVIGRQNGDVDISQLAVGNVERIEIVEGPMSVNYGTDALAGTINIITKSAPDRSFETAVNAYTESIGKYNLNGRLGFGRGGHSAMVFASRNFFDGWNPGEGFRYLDFKARVPDSNRAQQWDPKEEYNLNFQYGYQRRRLQLRFKSDLFWDQIVNKGSPEGYYGYTAFDEYYHTRRLNQSVFANVNPGRGYAISFLAAYSMYDRLKNRYVRDLVQLTDGAGAPDDQDTSGYRAFNSRATLNKSRPGKRLSGELGYDVSVEGGTGKRVSGGTREIGDYALYGSAEYKCTDSLTLRVGLRYAYNTAFQVPVIPSLHLKYNIAKGVVWRGSYSRGFRAPGIKELYFDFHDSNHDIVGNPALKAESSNNVNSAVVISRQFHSLNWSLECAAFFNSISNMINLALTDSLSNQYSYLNIDHFKSKGLQLNLTTRYRQLTTSAGASYIGRYNQLSEGSLSKLPSFTYAPEFRLNMSYEIPIWRITISLFCKYMGANPAYGMDSKGNVGLATVQAYTIADITGSWRLLKDCMTLSAGCKNLTNTSNVGRLGTANAGGAAHSAGGPVSIATGRSVFIGLGYVLKNSNQNQRKNERAY